MKKNILRCLTFCVLTVSLSLLGQESNLDIFEVSRNGSLTDLKELLKENPKLIDLKNKAGYTPLILACYNGNTEVAKYIADNCSDVNLNNGYGTALMAATIKRNNILVDYLLEKNTAVNISDANGTTALHYAVIFNLDTIAVKLIKAGAKYNLKDNRGNSAKDYAILKKKTKLLTLFKP